MPPVDSDQDEPQPLFPIIPSHQDSPSPTDTSTLTLIPIFTPPTFTLTKTITTASTAPTSAAPISTCLPLDCPTTSRSCPPCNAGYVCSLSVIETTCQCPIASCVKPGFDTGVDGGSNGSGSNPPSSSSDKKSVLAPVLGSIAGLIAIIVFAFLIIRYRRRKRRMNGDRLIDQEGQTDGSADPFNNSDKSVHNGLSWPGKSNEMRNQKDIIKIAYIPDIPNTEPFQLPELAHLGGGPHAAFFEDDYDKHVSVASSLSTGVLDEAVVMAMNNKATPKLLKLNAIKTNNSDMIQRSNSLHSSNSIKRTQSQRRVATAAAAAAANRALRDEDQKEKTKGNLSDETIQSENRDNVQQVLQQYTPAVMVTGPSARSSAQSTASTKRKSRPPNMVLEPRPLHPSYHVNQSSSPTRSLQSDVSDIAISGPSTKVTTSVSTPVTLASILTSTINTSLPPASASPTQSLPTGNLNNLRHSAEVLEGDERRVPWSSTPHHSSPNNNDKAATVNSPPTTRNSTFSTQSDSRSTITRGDGEEIMIFWDGHRDSRSSDNI